MAPFIWDLLLIAIWIFVSGVFAAAEIAVLVACRSRLKEEMLADRGKKKWSARLVLSLGQDPASLRCVTRLAVTLIGTLAAVLAGSRLLGDLTSALEDCGIRWVASHSTTFAMFIVTLGTALFWLVFGELVPKRLALANPERCCPDVGISTPLADAAHLADCLAVGQAGRGELPSCSFDVR